MLSDCPNIERLERKGLVPLRQGEKIRKLENKIVFIVWSQCLLQYLTRIWIDYQCSKLNTFLITIFLLEWGYCVYIDIPLRLSPAPTFGAQWCYIFLCTFVNIEWLDQLSLKCKIVTFMRWYRNRTISWTALVSISVFSPMLPNIMNIDDCNTWQLLTTRYGNRVR